MSFWVYILECADGSYYTGHTDNLEARIAAHKLGTFNGYTLRRRPVTLVFCSEFATRDEAFISERQIKGWSRRKKQALIKQDWRLSPDMQERLAQRLTKAWELNITNGHRVNMKRQHLVLAIGVISVSFAAIFIRLADAPSLVIAAYRMGLASIVIIPLAWARSSEELRRLSPREKLLALASGAFLALHFGLWIASLSYTSVATSVILVTTTPIFVAIVSYFLFHEKLGKQTGAGIIISLAGSLLIGYGNWQLGSNSLFGGILALLGALAVVGYLIIGRRLMLRISLLSYISLAYSSAAILLILAALVSGYSLIGYSKQTYLFMALLAIVPQLIGHSSVNWALRFISATLVTVAVLGEPVGATILASVVLKEPPIISEVIGGILILTGIFIAFRK